jgi:hypothetical protein
MIWHVRTGSDVREVQVGFEILWPGEAVVSLRRPAKLGVRSFGIDLGHTALFQTDFVSILVHINDLQREGGNFKSSDG